MGPRARLRTIAAARGEEASAARARAHRLRGRFDWQALVPQYLEMYTRLAPNSASRLTENQPGVSLKRR